MPELTVSMPTYNTAKFIGEAVESVLRQEGVDFELIIVDDGSKDNTLNVIRSFNDPRIRLISNLENRGISYCHNVVIDESESPFIAHVDSDDIVLPGAFQKMLAVLKSSSKIGQVHCPYMIIDEDGRLLSSSKKQSGMDYRRELLIRGGVINHLRTYRREVFDVIGKFNEDIKYSIDTEMAVRLVDNFRIKLVPETLYCRRRHKTNSSYSLKFRDIRYWYQRLIFCRQLIKTNKISFLKQKEFNLYLLMIRSLYRIFRLNICHLLSLNSISIYSLIAKHLSRCQINIYCTTDTKNLPNVRRLAYYLSIYPVLSETFIRREISTLRKKGLSIDVFADTQKDIDILDEDERAAIENTHYLLPFDRNKLLKYNVNLLLINPFVYVQSFLWVVACEHERNKTFKKDKFVFFKAVYLAAKLKENGIYHLHSPWANRSAIICKIAANLAGIPYSLEGRASDIHRKKNQYALKEKFENAKFIITNTRYNHAYISKLLNIKNPTNIHTIYEGIDLSKIDSKLSRVQTLDHIKLITVARLIEEKGITYLLKACRILKKRGYEFNCNIIGGIENQFISYYMNLMKLHRHFELMEEVIFSGTQPFRKVLEAYENADIFILPCVISKSGGRDISPNSLIEAMAMKLPVISTEISAIPELVENDISGILIPPKDENALSDAIVKLIEDPNLRVKLGKNARKKIEKKFDANKNFDSLANLFMN